MFGRRNIWITPPPRADKSEDWAKRLVAWLDQQDRFREILTPVFVVTITNAAQLNTDISCMHSLSQDTFGPGIPNVHWLVASVQHSGAGAGAGSSFSVGYMGGVVGKNTIELRFFANGLTINGGNPLTFHLHFWPLVEELKTP